MLRPCWRCMASPLRTFFFFFFFFFSHPGFGQSGTPDCLRRRVLFLLASIIVLIFGPGAFSVDAVLKRLLLAPRKKGTTVTASPLAEGHHGKLRSLS